MHHAIDPRSRHPDHGFGRIYAVTHRTLALAKMIARADDSSGMIGDAALRIAN